MDDIEGRKTYRSDKRDSSAQHRTQHRDIKKTEDRSCNDRILSNNNYSLETSITTTDFEDSIEENNQTYAETWEKSNFTQKQSPYYAKGKSTPQHRAFSDRTSKDKKDHRVYVMILILFPVAFFVIAFIGKNFLEVTQLKNCSYHDLHEIFPKEEQTIWRDLSIGLENILNHDANKPGVYLFIHEDKEYVRTFVKKVAKKSSSCFGDMMNPVEIKEEFSSYEDYGHIVESFKNNIKKSKVILIGNLNEIPAQTALALHPICDTYNPIEKNLVIFLTLVPSIFHGNPSSIARETLTTLWGSKLNPNQLDPLITRVTDAVIQLRG